MARENVSSQKTHLAGVREEGGGCGDREKKIWEENQDLPLRKLPIWGPGGAGRGPVQTPVQGREKIMSEEDVQCFFLLLTDRRRPHHGTPAGSSVCIWTRGRWQEGGPPPPHIAVPWAGSLQGLRHLSPLCQVPVLHCPHHLEIPPLCPWSKSIGSGLSVQPGQRASCLGSTRVHPCL